jgi:hypothetical protein
MLPNLASLLQRALSSRKAFLNTLPSFLRRTNRALGGSSLQLILLAAIDDFVFWALMLVTYSTGQEKDTMMPRRENFYLSGLEGGKWFGKYFEDFHLFGYVGDRDRLVDTLQRKSLPRQVLEAVVPSFSIGTILNSIIAFPLVRVDADKTLATRIINIVTEEENQRKITELLYRRIYKKNKSNEWYFHRVSTSELGKPALFQAHFNAIQEQLITVEGQLLHRSTISQFSRTLDATLRVSQGEWILADFPPQAVVEQNHQFTGQVLLLTEDPGFTRVFENYLPFWREIGWYPYVRITGFFDSSRLQTEIQPSLSISLVEYRRPRLFQEVRENVIAFGNREVRRNPIYLEERTDWILFGYLVALLLKGSNLTAADVDSETAELMRDYCETERDDTDLPVKLLDFYSTLPPGQP